MGLNKWFRYLITAYYIMFKPKKVNNPIHIQIEPTTLCNYDCLSCPRKNIYKNFFNMDVNKFKKIIDEVRPLKVTLNGLGEPLLHPNFYEIVKYMKDNGISVRITTNGSLLTSRVSNDLIRLGVNLLNVSLDAATQETYNKVRFKYNFEKIKKNIINLQMLKRKARSKLPHIRTSFVIQRENYKELSKFILLNKGLGVSDVLFQPLDSHFVSERRGKLVGDLKRDDLLGELVRAHKLSKKEGIKTNLSEILRDFDAYWNNYLGKESFANTCLKPWFSVYVTVYGDIKICCSLVSKEGTMGNIFNESFFDIWYSKKYQNIRNIFKKGKRPYLSCKHCVAARLFNIKRF